MEVGTEGSPEKPLDQGKHLTFLSFKSPGGSLPLCDLVRDDLRGKEYPSTQVDASKFKAVETTAQNSLFLGKSCRGVACEI